MNRLEVEDILRICLFFIIKGTKCFYCFHKTWIFADSITFNRSNFKVIPQIDTKNMTKVFVD